MKKKFIFYQRYGVEEYYVYDPLRNHLQGWIRQGDTLNTITRIADWVSPRLQVRFVLTPEILKLRILALLNYRMILFNTKPSFSLSSL